MGFMLVELPNITMIMLLVIYYVRVIIYVVSINRKYILSDDKKLSSELPWCIEFYVPVSRRGLYKLDL